MLASLEHLMAQVNLSEAQARQLFAQFERGQPPHAAAAAAAAAARPPSSHPCATPSPTSSWAPSAKAADEAEGSFSAARLWLRGAFVGDPLEGPYQCPTTREHVCLPRRLADSPWLTVLGAWGEALRRSGGEG